MHNSVWNEIENQVKKNNSSLAVKESQSKIQDIENAIIKYHIKERLPLLKMESRHFNELIDGKNNENAFMNIGLLVIFTNLTIRKLPANIQNLMYIFLPVCLKASGANMDKVLTNVSEDTENVQKKNIHLTRRRATKKIMVNMRKLFCFPFFVVLLFCTFLVILKLQFHFIFSFTFLLNRNCRRNRKRK